MSGPWETDELILAVDGGASKTDVWLVTSGGLGSWLRHAGRVPTTSSRGWTAPWMRWGRPSAMAAVDAGIDEGALPLAKAGVYCLAGVDLPCGRGAADRRGPVSGVDGDRRRAQ